MWPAAGVAFLWLAGTWASHRGRYVAFVLLFAVTVVGNVATGTAGSLALAFGAANVVQTAVACAVFARWRGGRWGMRRTDDLWALLVAAMVASVASAAIGPVAVWGLTDAAWPVDPAAWALRNGTSTIVVAGLGLRLLTAAQRRAAVNALDRTGEFVAVTLLAGGVYLVAFGMTTGVPLAFMVVPLSVWVALRYDTTLAALHGLFVGAALIGLTLAGHGPFALQDPQVRVMLAQAFIGVVSALTLVLALHRDERQQLLEERRQAEIALRSARDAALEASNTKTAFLANMSHEIRTPMNGVIGMTELLLDTPLDDRQRSFAEQARGSAQALLQIINDILDVTRIESGKLQFEQLAFSLKGALEDVHALLALQASSKDVDLLVQIDEDVPATLCGDPLRVRQVLTNLVGNAVKFTDRGQVVVTASVQSRSTDRVMVTIQVRDTGVGIEPELLPRLFAPFSQADASTTRRFGGTGLGLAIVRQLTELMGGQVAASSQPGRGSTFTVTLPFALLSDTARTSPRPTGLPSTIESREAAKSARDATLPVLVAEDNPVNQIVAVELLRKRGLKVELAENGHDAVTKAAERDYAAIFMDCQMPELDGYAATEAIRRHGNTVPIIALTAHAMGGDKEKCLAAGMDDYLAKPLHAAHLDAAIERWIGVRSATAGVHASAEASSDPLLDPFVLRELPNPEVLHEILELFVTYSGPTAAELAHALRTADCTSVERLSHALAGSAGSVGAVRLSKLATQATHVCGHRSDGEALAAVLERTFDDTAEALASAADALSSTASPNGHRQVDPLTIPRSSADPG